MLLDELKILMGEQAENFTEAQIALVLKMVMAEVEDYCGRELDYSLELICLRIAKLRLNTLSVDGISAQSFSGVSESFFDDLPKDIRLLLNSKRKIKVL